MKYLVFIPLIFIFSALRATDYYVATGGNDNNTGKSSSAPWRSISKVNSFFSTFRPGDRILFNRGDVFPGSLNITQSGTSGSPITFGAYGAGQQPIITGFSTITSWTNIGNNIWESNAYPSNPKLCNMVLVNGNSTPMGRYPNSGYLPYQSFVGNTRITSSSLPSFPNWQGAEVVIRKQRWVIDRNIITDHTGNTLTYIPSSSYNGQANYGFFIQNDIKTLDAQNEWYFDPNTKKLKIYSTSMPSNVQISTIDTLVTIKLKSYITFENITFEGANKNAFVILSSNDVTINYCNINHTGVDAIWGSQNWGRTSNNFKLMNSTISETNNNAIILADEFTNALISNNNISNTGVNAGMGGMDSHTSTHVGIRISASSPTIEYNTIKNTGYNAIVCSGDYGMIRNNFVDRYCMVKLDGAGIYTVAGVGGKSYAPQKILNNIVINGIGNNEGTNTNETPIAHGIYIDDWSADIEVAGNSIANCSHSGIYIHNAYNINVHDNTSFNNGLYQCLLASFDVNKPVRNDLINSNIFVAKQATQFAAGFQSRFNDFASFGVIDNNYYSRPVNDNGAIDISYNYYTAFLQYNLAQWQNFSGHDKNSHSSPKPVTDPNDIRFEYNASTSSKTISLDGNYVDVKNTSYNGSITLAPYTSAVLIRNGAATSNQPPVANAGNDQIIYLPNNTISLSGSGNDPDGTIVSYAWSKLSGPVGTINSVNSASTQVVGLVQGVYQFQLLVTDNRDATATDIVQIVVNGPTSNNPPTATAGQDQTITLPVNSVLLNGSGFDSDGSIASYQWSKVSGPVSAKIQNIGSSSTSVSDLTSGTYQFELKVIDDKGASNTDIIQVTVQEGVSVGELLPALNPGYTINGLEYDYYEGSGYINVPSDFSILKAVKSGTTNNFDLSLANRSEVFSFNFKGYVTVPADGYYTFYTNSDDGSKLYIDGRLVVNNDGQHGAIEISGVIGLKAGLHAISVGYIQQGGGSSLSVSYSSNGISKRVIPSASLYRVSSDNGLLPSVNPGSTTNGLEFQYYEGNGFTVVPTDYSLFKLVKSGISNNFDITLSNRSEVFSFNFGGYIKVPTDGYYTFYTTSDDGSKLFIDGRLVANNDGLHGAVEKSGVIGLQAGYHSITVGYIQQGGSATLNVNYSGPGITKQAIPSSLLYRKYDSGLLPAIGLGTTTNGVEYDYYESKAGYSTVPADFKVLVPVKSGTSNNFDISLANRSQVFSFNFKSYIKVPVDGYYTFYTSSDDGSKLFIDGILVANNDGLHGVVEKSGVIGLEAGYHEISVGYIQQGGTATLNVSYSGPGILKQAVPANVLFIAFNTLKLTGDKNMSTLPLRKNSVEVATGETSNAALDRIEVKAYPNPFVNSITISVSGNKGSLKISLIDAMGRILYSKEELKYGGRYQYSINTSKLLPGLYFIKTVYNNKATVIKVEK